MATNILETLHSKTGDVLAEHSAKFFDEEKDPTNKAIKGSFAATLAGMIQGVSNERGARRLHKILKSENVMDYDIERIFTRSPQTVNGLVNRGEHFLPNIYPSKLGAATNSLAKESGVTKHSSSKIMRLSVPLLLNMLGKEVQDNNLDINGLKNLLNAQKSQVESALPENFVETSELSAFGWTKKVAKAKEPVIKEKKEKKVKVKKEKVVKKEVQKAAVVEEIAQPVQTAAATTTSSSGMGFLKWLLPILLFIGIGWFLITRMGCGATDNIRTQAAPPAKTEAIQKAAPAQQSTAKAKATEVVGNATNAVKNVFGNVNKAAMGALGSIKFADGSVGSQIMNFIKGGASGDGRFQFKNLNFASGSAEISGETGAEVDNLASILEAYTDVKIKIEGYTDSQGNPASNQQLSQRRAEAVKTRLLGKGINASRISSQGFGADNPVADNGTAEGRAKNRRIEVVIEK